MNETERRILAVHSQLVEATALADASGHGRAATDDDCELCQSLRSLRREVARCDQVAVSIVIQRRIRRRV